MPHELLVCTNAAVQPGFTPPPNTAFKNALRYFVYPVKNTYFSDFYYPRNEGPEPHSIGCDTGFPLKENTDYKVSFWIRSTGNVRDIKYSVRGFAHGPGPDPLVEEENMTGGVSSSIAWNQFQDTIRFRIRAFKTKDGIVGFGFSLSFYGQGEVYLDDVRVRPADQP